MKKNLFPPITIPDGCANHLRRVFSVLAFFLLAHNSLAQGPASSNWPMFHGNPQHTGRSETAAPAAVKYPKWKLPLGQLTTSPIVGPDNTVYIGGGDGWLYAVTPNGSLKWKCRAGSGKLSTPALASDGTLYVGANGSNENSLYAFAADGSLKWKFQTDASIASSPVIATDGTVYVGSNDSYIYAVRPNGSLKWRYRTGAAVASSPAIAPDGTVYVGSNDTYLYALEPDGSLKWRSVVGNSSLLLPNCIPSPAIASDGTVYLGLDNFLYATNPDGTRKWKIQTGANQGSSPVIGADGTVYVEYGNFFHAIQPDGTEKWSFSIGSADAMSPVIGSDGTIYFRTSSLIWAIKPDSTLKWMCSVPTPMSYAMAIGDDGTVYACSEAHVLCAFGSLGLGFPVGGESLIAGETYTITWDSHGIAQVRIEYSEDNGLSWTTITPGVNASPGAFSWTAPWVDRANCLIRVTDASNPLTTVRSFSPFSLRTPKITVTAPNGGEKWMPGVSKTISWTSSDVDYLKLEYSRNNGIGWISIDKGVNASLGSYTWTPPSDLSSQCLVKFSDTRRPNVFDTSNASFSVVQPTLTVTSPNGGESWQGITAHNITWNSTSVSTITLEYSVNNGQTWTTIASDVNAAGGSYTWIVPNLPTTGARVRISSSEYGILDTSNSTFSVLAAIPPAITSPVLGESWVASNKYSITWSPLAVPTINLEYSINGGQTWATIASDVNAAGGYYNWTVPNTPTTNAIVRISNSGYGVSSTSNTFIITPKPMIAVVFPQGGEILGIGAQYSIQWVSNNVSKVKIQYSENNGASWTDIADNVDAALGKYPWSVPGLPSTQCLIQVSDCSSPNIYDQNNIVFSTAKLRMTLFSPNGGESLSAGKKYVIRWKGDDSIKKVKLYFTPDNGLTWHTIVENIDAASGNYTWTVPNMVSDECRIYISDALTGEYLDDNDAVFSIVPSMTLLSPNGGESWPAGSTQTIRWVSTGVNDVKLQYSADHGSTWTTITASTGAVAGSYPWTVPGTPGAEYLVRILDIENGFQPDRSDSVFTVTSDLAVLTPNGGESWVAGTTQTVTWSSSANGTVRIEYTRDGVDWRIIAPSVPASSGAYSWPIPVDIVTGMCRIRITDTAADFVTDESNQAFSIVASPVDVPVGLVLNSPQGGEQWAVGSIQNITWSSWKIVTVKLEFSTDDGVSWNTICIQGGNTEGSYAWTVPCTVSRKCLVRISDAANVSRNDQSDAAFTILPTVALTSPNGGESWNAGITRTIAWVSSGISSLKIEYTTNGITWTEIASNVDAASGSYSWAIPLNLANTTGRVRITDMRNGVVTDTSDALFAILPKPALTVIAPNGNEQWIAGTTQDITWQCSGISAVKIEYSSDGEIWTVIAPSLDASVGRFSWTIPAVSSNRCIVRIVAAADSLAADQSDAAFTLISPEITLTEPRGGEEWAATRTCAITWESPGVPLVKLEYSTDAGLTWRPVAERVNGVTGIYRWKIPETLSVHCLVRVSSQAEPGRSDMSGAEFSIVSPPVVQVIAPNGEESWRCGSVREITWTAARVDSLRIEYTLDEGKNWTVLFRSIAAAVGACRWALPDTASSHCLVRISDTADSGLADTSDAPFSILRYNLNAGFIPDSNVRTSGNQEEDTIPSIGGNTLIGFALYAREWENANGFKVTFSWDSAKAEFRPSLSAPDVVDDERTLNGDIFTPEPEPNILGSSLLSAGEENRPGFYTKSFARSGATLVNAPDGFAYLAVFRTAASFVAGDTLAIRVSVILADEKGVEKNLGVRFITLRKALLPPSSPKISDVSGDQGHTLRLTWTASPSERTDPVSGYRIYRSRKSAFTSPIPLTRFSSLDSLIFYEQRYTILIDSVPTGRTEFIDPFVPVNGAPYYYWVQTFGEAGASKPSPASRMIAVEEPARAPLQFRLGEARPNPFNPSTTIEYSIPEETGVLLEIYNISGQRVAILDSGRKRAGKYTVTWDARGLPSGVYLYSLRAGGNILTGKAVLMK